MKTIIITGANSGIGLESAKFLSDKGHRVIMACRNMDKSKTILEEMKKENPLRNLELMEIDLSDMGSVEKFAERFLAENKELDVLINNAGLFSEKGQVTKDGFELAMGVNYLGGVYLTELLLPVILKTEKARIIIVSSKAAFFGKFQKNLFKSSVSGFKAYSASKLAQALYTIHLSKRLAGTGVSVNSAHPGAVATNIWRGGTVMMKFARPVMTKFGLSPENGAKVLNFLAVSDEVEGITGKMFENENIMKYPKSFLDEKRIKDLMDETFEVLGMGNIL